MKVTLQGNRAWNAIRIGVWATACLIILLALAFTAAVATLPGCSFCHDSATFVSQTRARAHGTIECVRCHASAGIPHRITYAYNLVAGQTFNVAPADGGPITAIPDSTCLSCHSTVMQKKVSAKGLSIVHSLCAKGRRCTDCHADTAHGTAVSWVKTSDMNQCLECHNTERARSTCVLCHVSKSSQTRIRSGDWSVTHGPNWKQTHGMGDWKTCRACHPDDFCVKCHGIRLPHDADFIRTHPRLAATNRKDCNVCHQQSFCDACHGVPMPHPADFTPQHAKIVKSKGQEACQRCHVQDDCTNCHVRHVHPGGATFVPGTQKLNSSTTTGGK